MGEDDEVPSSLERRVDAVVGSEFELQPVTRAVRRGRAKGSAVPVAESVRLVELVEPFWWDWCPEEELGACLRDYRMLGVFVACLDWQTSSKRWSPSLRHLPAQFLRWDDTIRSYRYTAEEGDLVVNPGDGTWVCVEAGPRGWLRGSCRPLAIPTIGKALTVRDWNRYNERHGLPLIKAKVPTLAEDDDKDAFWEDLASLGSEIAVQLPTGMGVENDLGFDLELLEAQDKSYETFERNLARFDRKIQIHLIGGNLGAEVTNQGARSAADSHRGVERSKAHADAQKLSTEIRRQVLFPACAVNFGAPIEVVPWPHWVTEAPEDLAQHAAGQKAFADALGSAKTAGFRVKNAPELGQSYGLELEEAEDEEPPPAPPGGEPPPGDGSGEDDGKAAGEQQANARHVHLARGTVAGQRGFDDGAEWVDAMMGQAAARAGEVASVDLQAIVQAIRTATSADELRATLKALAGQAGLGEAALAEFVARAVTLASLAGTFSVVDDLMS